MRALVGIDLNDKNAEGVIAEAVGFCEKLGATLDVAFVDGLPYAQHLIHDPSVRGVFEEQAKRLKEKHLEQLDELVRDIPEPVRGKPVARYGTNVEETLVELSGDYDLLFVATHGRRGLDHFFMGSVAEKVIRKAKVPSLVLRGSTP